MIFDSWWKAFWFLLALFTVILYVFFKIRFNHWKSKHVPGPAPTFLFGNIKELLTGKHDLGMYCNKLYEETKHLPFVGFYMLHKPALLINDLDLIKTIMVKDFVHFMDHGLQFNTDGEPIFNTNGSEWKDVRGKMTPVFTPSKLKYMFQTFSKCGEDLIAHLSKTADLEGELDMKEIIAQFATNVLVSTTFGIDIDSFNNPSNDFRQLGRNIFDLDVLNNIDMFTVIFFPSLYKFIKQPVLNKKIHNFLSNVVSGTVKYRKESGVVRNDLMQLLIKLKNNESIKDNDYEKESESSDVGFSQMDLTSQTFGLFIAGFETSSTASSFVIYELAKRQDIQEKIRIEIDKVLEKNEEQITYEAINEMSYMNQVIEETLRLYPIVPQILRICTKDYKMPDNKTIIEKGTLVYISTRGIHKNPDYYADPENFDPDHFSPENKVARNQFAFLAFGEGPRMCIGLRFAMMQIKVGLVYIFKNYEVYPAGNGSLNISKRNSIILTPDNVIVKIVHRKK